MAKKDLFQEPYDESTLVKLSIFENYCSEWFPTFVHNQNSNVYIIDFFAGKGYDSQRTPGSPIRILTQILNYLKYIFKNRIQVNVILNEKDGDNFNSLKSNVERFINQNQDLRRSNFNINVTNNDFEECFTSNYSNLLNNPCLLY
jgi:three-Cys-motif partner protein